MHKEPQNPTVELVLMSFEMFHGVYPLENSITIKENFYDDFEDKPLPLDDLLKKLTQLESLL